MPRPGGCETGPGASRSHQEARPISARTCNRPRCSSCVGQRPNSTSGRAGFISSSTLGRSLKLARRLMSICSLACRKVDRRLSTRKPNGCGAGQQPFLTNLKNRNEAFATFNLAREPKKLVILPGGHFEAYVGSEFKQASGAACDWFI